jgi:hypothetical protein
MSWEPERIPSFWTLQIGGWTFMLVTTFLTLWQLESDWRGPLVATTVRQSVGCCLTAGLREIFRRWPANMVLSRLILKASIFPIACAVLDVALTQPFFAMAGMTSSAHFLNNALGLLILRGGVYSTWTALYFWLRQISEWQKEQVRVARMEAASREAELESLRAQVNPHFLFNALNSILAEIDCSPDNARATTEALAEYLRFSLRQRAPLLPFSEELDAITHYLEVEKRRFEDGLRCSLEADPASRAVATPPALLQPLVENAIKYGMKTSPSPLILRVSAATEKGWFELVVENSGHWFVDGNARARGTEPIGLDNLQRRLELLYHGKASLTKTAGGGFVRVVVRIPLDESGGRKESAYRKFHSYIADR